MESAQELVNMIRFPEHFQGICQATTQARSYVGTFEDFSIESIAKKGMDAKTAFEFIPSIVN